MGDTTALLDEVALETLVSPHVYNEDGRVVKNDYFPYTRIHGPCNNLYTSVDDLSCLALAHLNRGELDGTCILLLRPTTRCGHRIPKQAGLRRLVRYGPAMG